MKKFLFLLAILSIAVTQNNFAQNSTRQDQLPHLLTYYYNIKNALVGGNANSAASAAASFVKAANSMYLKIITEESVNALVKDAGLISQTSDIKKQRTYFTDFSTNMIALVKAVKVTETPVYIAYCPMKKAFG